MKKNDVFELNITGMTHEGLGVGRNDGMAVFVPGAIPGETVNVKIMKVLKNYSIARIEKWLYQSPDRQNPFCPVYKRCGGCSLQHMTYERQLAFKHQVVKDSLSRIGGLKDVTVKSVIGMDSPMRYRNKAQYPVGKSKNGPVSGFYARHSHEIVHCENCRIQDTTSQEIKNRIMDCILKYNIPVYDEKMQEGLLRHIIIRVSRSTGDVMVIMVVTKDTVPHLEALVKDITASFPAIHSIILSINNRRDNVVMGKKNITVYGRDTIIDRIGPFHFHISPLSFYQVNPTQTEILYEKAVEYAQLSGKETVFDLYCGIGTISLFLAQKAKKVIGVEVVKEAVESAKKNADYNHVTNTEFYHGTTEKITENLYKDGIKADVVVVDPPRKGCDQSLLETIINICPHRIVYVSCNPSTLARDLKYLNDGGYQPVEVQPVDMFPWTEHIETVCLMSRVKD